MPSWIRSKSPVLRDRKSTRLNSSHTVIYTLSLHDALPISCLTSRILIRVSRSEDTCHEYKGNAIVDSKQVSRFERSEEHTSELQSHSDLHSFPTRRSSDLLSHFKNTD